MRRPSFCVSAIMRLFYVLYVCTKACANMLILLFFFFLTSQIQLFYVCTCIFHKKKNEILMYQNLTVKLSIWILRKKTFPIIKYPVYLVDILFISLVTWQVVRLTFSFFDLIYACIIRHPYSLYQFWIHKMLINILVSVIIYIFCIYSIYIYIYIFCKRLKVIINIFIFK